MKLFLCVRHSLNWIIPFPDSFLDTLHELDAEKMVLFHFKLEIEGYYNGNIIMELRIMEFNNSVTWNKIGKREDYSKLIAIPGKEWHLTRFNNISDYSTVTIPGFCSRCRTEGAFFYGTLRYLDCIISIYDIRPQVYTENATNVMITMALVLLSCCFPTLQ